MKPSAIRTSCCPAHDPCPRHLRPEIAASAMDRARAVDGASPEALDQALDARGVSRRGLLSLTAAGASATAFAIGAPRTAQAAPAAPASASAVFGKPTGKTHVLPSTKDSVRVGVMDPSAPTALEIESGDVVHYPNTWVNWANEAKYGMGFAEREPIRKRYPQGPYSLIGPVVVRGAEPGDIIECRIIRTRPIEWGWNSAPKGVGALPADFDQPYLRYVKFDADRRFGQFADGVKIPLAPIQGVIATQPTGDKPVSAILSGPYGGNIVLRELVEGTALFLPVQVPGARLWTGDSHAAQGDGVVDQTAIETAMEDLRIQYVLHKARPLAGPIAETPTAWIVMGFAPTLEDALTASLRQTIDWLSAATGLPKVDVYALCSISGSFRITQYSHQTGSNYTSIPSKAVHGVLPKAVFSADRLAQISASVRGRA